MTAASNTALVVRVSSGQSPTLSIEDIPLPKPAENQVLVKLSHVAQNPTDGVGAYSHYCLADERISYKLPGGVSRAEASTLFSKDCLGLDRSQASGSSVLVWGGSTSVGLYAVQLASLCGFDVVATCSPKHFDLVKSYGAKHVFDYKDEQVAEKIREAVPNLLHVFDTVGNQSSSTIASQAFRSGPGALCTVRPGKANTENVAKGTQVTDVLVWTSFLKDHSYGEFKWPASKHDHELSAELFERLPQWAQQGSLKPNNPKVYHGLDAVRDGFQEYPDGKISAYKIVYVL
ncbi:hypothetical protein BDW66DRAFT_166746 [Aspergillus desertorum]